MLAVISGARTTIWTGCFFLIISLILFARSHRLTSNFPLNLTLSTSMDRNNMRRASSAGYRGPEKTTQPAAACRARSAKRDPVNPDRTDPVKQDRLWKELVWSEKRGVQEWEKNWDFLRHYDQMGQLKSETPLPSCVSLFSSHFPNTTNQVLGSRLSTPLGRELVRLDRMLLWSENNHKRKLDPDMLPC